MKFKLLFLSLLLTLLVIPCKANDAERNRKQNDPILKDEPRGKDNVAYQWAYLTFMGTAHDTDINKPRPTITSRFIGLVFTSMFDAWTRFDDKASPLYLKNVERLPQAERNLRNKEIAISYAAYNTLKTYYPFDLEMFREKMVELGLDPDDKSLDPTTPVGIGNLAAKTVIERRMHDGSNQFGEVEGSDGTPYSDYTGYMPVNDIDNNIDLKRWQPKYFINEEGEKYNPGCLTPYWQKVEPLLLKKADQFRPGPPPEIGSKELEKEVQEVVDLQANLTPENKALVEFMRDGPLSAQQAGHWLVFSMDVAERDQHTLDEDVKMYFYVESVALDGFIACWDAKMYYDFARPYALVHAYFKDKTIRGWGGPDKGMMTMKGQDWRPYSPASFLCPSFPSYVSGHSTISGGCAEALRLFTGSDKFGAKVKRTPGELTEPNNVDEPVILEFPTFTKAGEMAGISRVMGGYHIQSDNQEGLTLGRNIARYNYQKFLELIGEKPMSSKEQMRSK